MVLVRGQRLTARQTDEGLRPCPGEIRPWTTARLSAIWRERRLFTPLDTSVISYRVADFLKRHPPFQAMDEGDFFELAGRGASGFARRMDTSCGREPRKLDVFVIQRAHDRLSTEAQRVAAAGGRRARVRHGGEKGARQQARIGISQGTNGAELPPALLSRHDRHVLKSGSAPSCGSSSSLAARPCSRRHERIVVHRPLTRVLRRHLDR
jgi:hypothetical protein